MEQLEIKNLTFSYPLQNNKALSGINLTVREGDFILVCGESGSGKSTLLKLLKSQISPVGEKEGEIIFDEKDLCEAEPGEIGFVSQNPDMQLVTDKVWHELSFGLENLGIGQQEMRRRVAEMTASFGLEEIYHRETDTLSGGEKQLLNLSGVLVMGPKLLLLDEPTSQLDPIAATHFLQLLKKINDEWGTTIIITEHRLEECVPLADRLVVLKNGEVIACDEPQKLFKLMLLEGLSESFPAAMQIAARLGETEQLPITVKQGRSWISKNINKSSFMINNTSSEHTSDVILTADNIWFSYGRDLTPVIRGTDLELKSGEILCVLGGNGSGKSTLASVLAGMKKPMRGKIKKPKELKICLLPQNPDSIFMEDTVGEDYRKYCLKKNNPAQAEARIKEITGLVNVENLLDKNPYDLSGGELQLCAFAKLLLAEPELLILDEPTKGMDVKLKATVTKILKKLAHEGKTILVVTHDANLAAGLSDRCALFFDGQLFKPQDTHTFFYENRFYTTPVSRLCRQWTNAITVDEVLASVSGGKN